MDEQFNSFENNQSTESTEGTYSQQPQMNEYVTGEVEGNEKKTPGIAIAALIMAIVAVVLLPVSCCCQFMVILSLGLAIAALIMSIKGSKAMIEQYGEASGVAKAAKIIAIIAIVLSVIVAIIVLIYVLVAGGAMIASGDFDGLFDSLY